MERPREQHRPTNIELGLRVGRGAIDLRWNAPRTMQTSSAINVRAPFTENRGAGNVNDHRSMTEKEDYQRFIRAGAVANTAHLHTFMARLGCSAAWPRICHR